MQVQSDTLSVAHVFENFRNMCIKVHELDLAPFLSVTRLAWQACLKKAEIELEVITAFNMLIRGGICHAIHRYVKINNKYMKNYDKNEESLFLEYLDVDNLYGYAMSKPLPAESYLWIENASKIDECFVKTMMKIVIKDIYLK